MSYTEKDLVKIAKRENNTKRSYLVVNPLQGKHVPVSPGTALALFDELAECIRKKYKNERLLLIGFAETATAIGAEAAVRLSVPYIQTTREAIPGVSYIFFSEEHSHATEQKLVREDMDLAVSRAERIIFVEDEVTTGKTILNIISVLERLYAAPLHFGVASLLNGMDESALKRYREKGIDPVYLVKTDHRTYTEAAERCVTDGIYTVCDSIDRRGNEDDADAAAEAAKSSSGKRHSEYVQLHIGGAVNARRLTDGAAYEQGCSALWESLSRQICLAEGSRVLVLGTEECMYPALFVGSKLEQAGHIVKSHSTTRSPIEVSSRADYPLHRRYQLNSLYDEKRTTYIYDIDTCDLVIVITDAAGEGYDAGSGSLHRALSMHNRQILLVRW